jgi:hypothetical protein
MWFANLFRKAFRAQITEILKSEHMRKFSKAFVILPGKRLNSTMKSKMENHI